MPVDLAEVDDPEGALVTVAVAMPLVLEPLEPAGVVVTLTEADEAGVDEPAAVGAVIKLCSVALKVPVMPAKVNLAEKPS